MAVIAAHSSSVLAGTQRVDCCIADAALHCSRSLSALRCGAPIFDLII